MADGEHTAISVTGARLERTEPRRFAVAVPSERLDTQSSRLRLEAATPNPPPSAQRVP